MLKPVPTDSAPIVGETYDVVCLRFTCGFADAFPFGGRWWPTIGPRHEDETYLNFAPDHYHIDWRFVNASRLREWPLEGDSKHGRVLIVERDGEAVSHEIKVRRRRCEREFLHFPEKLDHAPIRFRDTLREAFADCPLKPGLVCPHKGIALAPFADSEGIAICPGHGLAWNLNERRLATEEEETAARTRRAPLKETVEKYGERLPKASKEGE